MVKSMKRDAPDPVKPVTIGSVRYDAPHFAEQSGGRQNGGTLTATDVASGRLLWNLQVYETAYDEAREQDVQDVFITQLVDLGGGKLLVLDEDGRRHTVDLERRTAQRS